MEGTDTVEDKIYKLRLHLKSLLGDARHLNTQGEPTRSRELSLAVTALEEAAHWLREIVDKE